MFYLFLAEGNNLHGEHIVNDNAPRYVTIRTRIDTSGAPGINQKTEGHRKIVIYLFTRCITIARRALSYNRIATSIKSLPVRLTSI